MWQIASLNGKGRSLLRRRPKHLPHVLTTQERGEHTRKSKRPIAPFPSHCGLLDGLLPRVITGATGLFKVARPVDTVRRIREASWCLKSVILSESKPMPRETFIYSFTENMDTLVLRYASDMTRLMKHWGEWSIWQVKMMNWPGV